jgi:predicted MFS family arabinose efflux permease
MEQRKNNRIIGVILFGLIACILYGLGAGIRGDIGILLDPLAEHSGIYYDDASLCIAVMELVFGAIQPFFGILAAKTSNRFVLTLGSVLLVVSFAGMYFLNSFAGLMISLGIIFGAGAGALAFGLILTSAIHFVGKQNAMLISGMLNASAGMVSFFLSPALTQLLETGGLTLSLIVLSVLSVFLVPVTVIVTSRDKEAVKDENEVSESEESRLSLSLIADAFHNRTYRFLIAGFSTCGFHMIIIETHLYSQYVSYGISKTSASWAFSIYGIATIAGALLSGWLSTKVKKGGLLGFYYGFRAVWVALYIFLMPKNVLTAVIFSTGLGMTGDATVSPTSGLVNENFKLKEVATLIGLLFTVHQIGAFMSAWLGGVIVKNTGGYTLLWLLDIALCIMASTCSLLIDKKRVKNVQSV